VLASDDANSLARRVLAVEHKIYPIAAQWFCSGRLIMQDGRAVLDNEILSTSGKIFAQDSER